MALTRRWRHLPQERLDEAVGVLGAVPGVHGLIVGGSVGRGEPWPMSDIDLLPVYGDPEAATEVSRLRGELVDWWAASGRAQTLDLGRLAFTVAEVEAAVASRPSDAAGRMLDDRWFHGIDKSYGGRPSKGDELVGDFLEWVSAARFDPAVVAVRIEQWRRAVSSAADRAARADSPEAATHHLRDGARALRLVLLEGWGERLGSMGREWTRFERMAARRGEAALAARVAVLAGAEALGALHRASAAPLWLQERVDLCLAARQEIGEDVTPDENARDQLAAFAVHVVKYRPDLAGPWMRSPDPRLGERLEELRELLGSLVPVAWVGPVVPEL